MDPFCISQVKPCPTDDEIHQAHLDSIKVIHVEPPCSSLPQEPASAYLSGGLGLTLGLGVGGLAALSIPLLEASGSSAALQGLSQKDALSLLSLQPFQTGFLLQPDGCFATASAASSGAKPGEAGGTGIMELADIQQILKVAAAAPNQMGLTLPALAKAPGFSGGQGECLELTSIIPDLLTRHMLKRPPSSSRSGPGSKGNAPIEAQTPHHPSLQPHSNNSSPPSELPAGFTGLHQPQPAATHADPLQNTLLILSIFLISWERRADGC